MKTDVTFGNLWNESIDFFKKNFMMLFLVGLLLYFAPRFYIEYNSLIGQALNTITREEGRKMIISFASMSISSALLAVSIAYSVKSKKKNLSFGEVINGASKYYLKAICLSIVLAFALIFLFMLLIVPGIVFLIYWIFSTYILVFEDVSIIESMRRSMNLVKDKWWNVFFMVSLLGITTGVINLVLNFGLGIFNYIGISSGLFMIIAANLISMVLSIFMGIFIINYYLALKK